MFDLGQIVATPAALNALRRSSQSPADFIRRHGGGDWGDVDEDDRTKNELSLEQGFRLFSVYHAANGVKFWLITEADRSHTTVLLPEDY